MATVAELAPGDLVTLPSPEGVASAVFVARVPHSDYPGLMLVIWKLDDDTWSFDALDPRQYVGELTPSTIRQRTNRLRVALTGS